MDTTQSLYHRHRFPAEIISHCVWLYFRFSLSFRDVEEMMAKRGVTFSYESARDWCLKFSGVYAKRMRSRSPRPGDRWHLDEVFLKIQGKVWRIGVLSPIRRPESLNSSYYGAFSRGMREIASRLPLRFETTNVV
jgi:hypothetical protein